MFIMALHCIALHMALHCIALHALHITCVHNSNASHVYGAATHHVCTQQQRITCVHSSNAKVKWHTQEKQCVVLSCNV